jgi:hypothetical protein
MRREREKRAEQRERECFHLLQRLYTLTEGNTAEAHSGWTLGAELGFDERETRELVDHLVWSGCVTCEGDELLLGLTPGGIDYIERLAWRRHSVRRN